MPRNPDVPCAGGCGRMCWRSRTCRAPGEQMCQQCRTKQTAAKAAIPNAVCALCEAPFRSVKRSDGRSTATCSKRCAGHLNALRAGKTLIARDPAKVRAIWRARNHRRRGVTRHGDVTAKDELAMRTKAKRCPLCRAKLVDLPYLPLSKELDHIVPRNVGGTHTHGNVRIICRACNVRRPKDGSDYFGPVTLWAQAG